MATITKVQNNILITTDYSAVPVTISNWTNTICTTNWAHGASSSAIGDPVNLTIDDKRGYRFSDDVTDRYGVLTAVNGIDTTAFTGQQIVNLINSSVLTPDKFSGTPVIIDDTTQYTGSFTAIQVDEEAVLDTTAVTGSIMVDGSGNAIDISGYTGVALPVGFIIYGQWTAIKLVSGTVTAYSNR